MTLAANAQDRPEAMPGALSEPAGIRQAPRPELSAAIVGPDGLAAMAELALLVSGLEPSRVPAYRDRLLTMAESARDQVAASSQASGEALLVYLHGSAGPFRRYLAKQTRIDVLLDSGTFNCVSSAVVYWLAAGAAGLDVGAVGTRDHAFCTVRANGREVDVETTIAYGYDPGRRQDFRDAFGKVTGMVWVPAGNYTTRQALDFRHLLGLVLQNLAADAQERRDDLSPVGLAWDSAALVGLEAARPLLSTAYHNRAAGLNASGDYPGAMAVVLAAESRLGPSPDRAVLVRGIASNLLVVAMSQRNWPEAHALLSRWRDRLGPLVRQSAVNLFRLESLDVFRKDSRSGWGAVPPNRRWSSRNGAQPGRWVLPGNWPGSPGLATGRPASVFWRSCLPVWTSCPESSGPGKRSITTSSLVTTTASLPSPTPASWMPRGKSWWRPWPGFRRIASCCRTRLPWKGAEPDRPKTAKKA
jgi:hypothetical protein